MYKIWYRNRSKSEVIGHCGGDENTEWPRRTDKIRKTVNSNIKCIANIQSGNNKDIAVNL